MFGTAILTLGRQTVVIPLMRPVKCERTKFLKRINGSLLQIVPNT